VPVLARSFRVLTFDNRDVGRSSRSPWPYGLSQMVDDAVGVRDAAAVQRAHNSGISLGGMVSQELALRHPRRVSRAGSGSWPP
jgi:pimeloyl-ACP methyl ester carboxylesterase